MIESSHSNGQDSSVGEIELEVNGRRRHVREGSSVRELLEMLELSPATIVVEYNRDILDRERYSETVLKEGDRLELVHFVGGG
ncbi:MAG: sulfur carrier protein ThiS [Gemmatimonadota bacterium]